jgi:hypothetical protein
LVRLARRADVDERAARPPDEVLVDRARPQLAQLLAQGRGERGDHVQQVAQAEELGVAVLADDGVGGFLLDVLELSTDRRGNSHRSEYTAKYIIQYIQNTKYIHADNIYIRNTIREGVACLLL